MTTGPIYKSPPFAFDYLPQAVSLIPAGTSPPPGIRTAISNMRADWTNAQTEGIGTTHHYVNAGQPNTGTPFAKRAMMDKGDGLYNMLGGASLFSASEATCRSAAHQINPNGAKAAFYMTEFGEKLTESNVNFVTWNGSNQKMWLDQEMSTLVTAAGGVHYSDYDGHLDSTAAMYGDRGAVRTALASNSGALNFALANSGFGNPYYIGSAGAFRGGVLKMYQTGGDDIALFVLGNIIDMMLDKGARAQRGYTTRVSTIFWPGFDERLQKPYTGQIYRRPTPSGGPLTRSAPPYACFPAETFLQAVAQLLGFDTFNWTEPELFGSNPAISIGPGMAGGVTASGDVGQLAPSVYEYTTGPAGYPYSPKGTYDIAWAGIHLADYVHKHAGTASWVYAPIKINGGAASATGTAYPVDQYEGQKVVGFVFSSLAKRSYIGFDANTPGTPRQITIPIPGGVDYTYTSCGQTYHAQNFTV